MNVSADPPDRFPIYRDGVIAAHESGVRGNDGIPARQAVAICGDVEHGVDENRPSLDALPDRRCRLHQLFLKNPVVRLPDDFQGHFRAQADALGAADAEIEIVFRVFVAFDSRRPGQADFDAYAAAGAFVPGQNRMDIGMHALLLRPRGKAHGEVLDGPPETRREMPLEMRKNEETVRPVKNTGNLGRLEVLVAGGNVHNIRPSNPSAITTGQPR